MKDFVFAGVNLKKEKQISAPLEKRDGRGNHFSTFSIFFPHFSPSSKRRKKYLPSGGREIFSFSRD